MHKAISIIKSYKRNFNCERNQLF